MIYIQQNKKFNGRLLKLIFATAIAFTSVCAYTEIQREMHNHEIYTRARREIRIWHKWFDINIEDKRNERRRVYRELIK